ncbi:hypothetical protein WR25_16340 [Diploscapter pachys]|uniref:TatD related DNase n=1 Tax=Diploscapter pachys TaxID=2018661 RepID=A0A2A2LQX4_9BILA|nr:hypothetical protein WR25_16340 [Diploscapter pachys]
MKSTNGVTKGQVREKEDVGLVDEEAEQGAQGDGLRNGQTEAKETEGWERLPQQIRQAQAGDAAWEDEPTDIETEHNAQWQEHYVDRRAVQEWQRVLQEQHDQAGDWQETGQTVDEVLLQTLQYGQTEAVNAATTDEGEEELQLKEDVDYGRGQTQQTQQEQEWDNFSVGPNQPIRVTKVKKASFQSLRACASEAHLDVRDSRSVISSHSDDTMLTVASNNVPVSVGSNPFTPWGERRNRPHPSISMTPRPVVMAKKTWQRGGPSLLSTTELIALSAARPMPHQFRPSRNPYYDSFKGISPFLRTNQCRIGYVDSHCHLDLIWFKYKFDTLDDLRARFPAAFPRNFMGCIPNFCDPNFYMPNRQNNYDQNWLAAQLRHVGVFGTCFGVHPNNAGNYTEEVHNFLIQLATEDRKKYKLVAIGECGIDFYRNGATRDAQVICFERQLEIATTFGLPVVIHCRSGMIDPANPDEQNAEDFCLQIMMRKLHRFHPIHRHCYTGTIQNAQKWINAFPHIVFGFTPIITKEDSPVRDTVRHLPLTRIVLETDAPYFNFGFRRMEGQTPSEFPEGFTIPTYACLTACAISDIKQICLPHVLKTTRENTARVYLLNGVELFKE